MLRLLMICVMILAPAGTATRANDQPAQHDGELQAARRIGEIVRARFALAAEARSCRPWDNLYGYNLLLQQLNDAQQTIVRAAQAQGRQQGLANTPDAGPQAACVTRVRKLDDADNQLLVLAEQTAAGGAR